MAALCPQVNERTSFECWHQNTRNDVYKKHFQSWSKKIRALYAITHHLKKNFPTTETFSQKDVETIVRHSYVVPISQDRFRVLLQKQSVEQFLQKRDGNAQPFLWKNHSDTADDTTEWPSEHVISTVADRIALSLISTEMKQRQEQRQTQAVVNKLLSMGFQERRQGSSDTFEPSRLEVNQFQTQFRIKSKYAKQQQLLVDVAVRTATDFYFIELKSASDEANTSKRWKEEGERYAKTAELAKHYELDKWNVIVVLTGYFTTSAMEKFQQQKEKARCIWFYQLESQIEKLLCCS